MNSPSAKRQYPRKADIVRAIQAARASGFAVGALECRPDGTIKLLPGSEIGDGAGIGLTDFEEWEAAGRL
jgi:hypothetical protein